MASKQVERGANKQDLTKVVETLRRIASSTSEVEELAKGQDDYTKRVIAQGFEEIRHHLRAMALNIKFPKETILPVGFKELMREGIRRIHLEVEEDGEELRSADALKLIRVTERLVKEAAALNVVTSGMELEDPERLRRALFHITAIVAINRTQLLKGTTELQGAIRT